MPQESGGGLSELLSEFSTKLKSIEERHNLLKERVMLLNQTFLKGQDKLNTEIMSIKNMLADIKQNVESIKDGLNHIISESAEFARKEELKILERYMKMWEPLKFVKEDEVRQMIDNALKETKKRDIAKKQDEKTKE